MMLDQTDDRTWVPVGIYQVYPDNIGLSRQRDQTGENLLATWYGDISAKSKQQWRSLAIRFTTP